MSLGVFLSITAPAYNERENIEHVIADWQSVFARYGIQGEVVIGDDGSVKTLEEVVQFYNNGGRLEETDPVPELLSGGIRPLNLSDKQQADLVEFMKALTSPEFVKK